MSRDAEALSIDNRWCDSPCKHLLIGGLLAVVSWLGIQLGWLLGSTGGYGDLFWPLTGIAAGAVFRWGSIHTVAVFAAAVAAYLTRHQWPAAVGLGLGDALTAVAIAMIWRQPAGPGSPRAILAVLGVLLATSLYATCWLFGTGRADLADLPNITLRLLLGMVAGLLLFAPVLINRPMPLKRQQLPEMTVTLGLLLATCSLVFLLGTAAWPWAVALSMAPLLLVVVIGVRRCAWCAAVAWLIVFGFVAWSLVHSTGVLQAMPTDARLFFAWAYCTAMPLMALRAARIKQEWRDLQSLARQGEENYRALVEDNPALICRFDAHGRLAFANETFNRFFGGISASTAGADFLELSGLAADADFMHQLQELRGGDPAITAERPMISEVRSGWFRWTVRVVKESSGRGVEYHAVGMDVTEQVLIEQQQRLIESQVVQAQKLESVGVLAGGIAHEFNNLLAGVLGHAELAETLLDQPQEARLMLAEVRQQAQRAAALSHQLLDYARRNTQAPELVDLSELIRGMTDLFTLAVPKRCPLQLELAEGLPLVRADVSRLRQLVMTLTTNAGEAAQQTGSPIIIRTRTAFCNAQRTGYRRLRGNLPDGWCVMIDVEQGGSGLEERLLNNLFEPFFMVKHPGAGLGLAAALGIVKDHGGAIGVCSTVGVGTLVSVLLPPADSATAAAGQPEHHPVHAATCRPCTAEPTNLPTDRSIRRRLSGSVSGRSTSRRSS